MTQSTIIFGILIPSAVFIFSFVITYALYVHFSKQHSQHK